MSILAQPTVSSDIVARLDPRVKVIGAFLYALVVALSQQLVVLFIALMVSLGVTLVAKLSPRLLAARLGPTNLFLVLLWILLPLSYQGGPSVTIGPLTLSSEGIDYALRLTIRANAILLTLIVLIASTSVLTLGHTLQQLGVSKKLVHLLFFTYRYIHVLHREYTRLITALTARGFRAKTNVHTYKTLAYLMATILVRSCERARRVHNAMLCRGFNGELYGLGDFSFQFADAVASVVMFATIVVLGVMEWTAIV